MVILLVGLIVFVTAFILQVVIWRVRVPRGQLRALVSIFAVVILGALGLIICFQDSLKWAASITVAGLALIALLAGGLCASYLIFFTAVEAGSPSLMMINLIHDSGRRGLKLDSLRQIMKQRSFAGDRIERMLQDGMATVEGDRLRYRPAGGLLLSIVLSYRHLLGRGPAGG